MEDKLKNYFRDFQVKGISFDSRTVKTGYAFFAIKGDRSDGNDFIDQSIKNGAAIVFTDNLTKANNKNIIYIKNIRMALAVAAGIFYPNIPRFLIAVTGTNGKSSVVSYLEQIISLLGKSSASIGTIGISASKKFSKDFPFDNIKNLTTADPITFRKILHFLANEQIDYVIFEASSHGLHQDRIGDLKIDAAAFTSFSQDHLEYHKTLKNYLQAKLKLFSNNLSKAGQAVFNSEVIKFPGVKTFLDQHKIKFTIVGANGDINIIKTSQTLDGQEIEFQANSKRYKIFTEIIGSFQASNLLIAARLAKNIGFDFDKVIQVLPMVKAVSGRLQQVTGKMHNFHIFIDYAHTPDALERSLKELKKLKSTGKLIVIFGCGGNRDQTKRPIMGRIAEQNADKIVITDDNPRMEDASKIRSNTKDKSKIIEIADRKKAITNIIANLQKGDILLIAGKGHEDYQIIGNKKISFSDFAIVNKTINICNNS